MKKILPILFSLFSLFHSSSFAYTQEEFDQAYKNYVNSTSVYLSESSDFALARGRYLSFKTISAEEEALIEGKKMTGAKINLIKDYLVVLRIKFALATGIIDYQENLIYIQLDNEITSYLNSLELLNSSSTLKNLDKLDQDLGIKFRSSTVLAFKALGLMELDKMGIFLERLSNQHNLLKEKLEMISQIEVFEADPSLRRLDECGDNIKIAQNELASLQKIYLEEIGRVDEPNNKYSELLASLGGLQQKMGTCFVDFEEIINSILKI